LFQQLPTKGKFLVRVGKAHWDLLDLDEPRSYIPSNPWVSECPLKLNCPRVLQYLDQVAKDTTNGNSGYHLRELKTR
jgi:hypothetical protein